MSLFVKIKNIRDPMELHVPVSIDAAHEVATKAKHGLIEQISADGHELELIVSRMRGIPIAYYSCIWADPWATWIGLNFLNLT